MLFNSTIFAAFALVFFALWPLANRTNPTRWAFLTGMSLVFYGWWDWRFIFLLIGTGLIDFVCGRAMAHSADARWRRTLLLGSLTGNLGALGFFKYGQFIARGLDSGLARLGLPPYFLDALPDFTLILPVGISFYTFQSMSYTIDIYRGRCRPADGLLHFFSYLAMFPQLVAGPIVRARAMLGQLRVRRTPTTAQIWHGIKLFGFGLFWKTVIADHLGRMVDTAFAGAATADDALFWWVVVLGFALQIYADFSGYSLMARGVAKGMGLHIHRNFRHPYTARSLREFWRRWHISLSTWFRDYVYIPLGGGRRGALQGLAAMTITMLLSGLWHGAAMTFVVWGGLHALFLGLERTTGYNRRLQSTGSAGTAVAYAATMLQVALAWVVFRAEDLAQARTVYTSMFAGGLSLDVFREFPTATVCLGIAVALELLVARLPRWRTVRRALAHPVLDALVVAAAFLAGIYLRGPDAAFIYFQF